MSIGPDEIDLAAWLQEAEIFCEKHSIPLIYGCFESRQSAAVLFRGSLKTINKTRDYFQCLESLSSAVTALIVDIDRLTESLFQHRLDQVTSSASDTQNESLKEIESYRGQIDQAAGIGFSAILERPNLILSHDICSDWYGVFFGEAEAESGFRNEYEEDPSENNDRIEKLARRVAEDQRLELTRNQGERVRITKAVLQDEPLERYDADIIAKQAWELFRIEIKPKRDEILLPQAEQLEADGYSVSEIAKKLGIPVPNAKRLLGR